MRKTPRLRFAETPVNDGAPGAAPAAPTQPQAPAEKEAPADREAAPATGSSEG